jgi:hypothetical protein
MAVDEKLNNDGYMIAMAKQICRFLINTPLQRGGGKLAHNENRFNGFSPGK